MTVPSEAVTSEVRARGASGRFEPMFRSFATNVLPSASLTMMIVALAAVFLYVPNERDQGIVQRIFYFHVPSAISTFLCTGIVALGSVMFLWRGTQVWDRLAESAAEVALLFCSVVLTTGPIWAKPIWGTWWTWDARLTTTLILWLTLVAYLMVRAWAPSREQGARYAAIIGIVGALDVPIIQKSVHWWRTIHPAVLVTREGTYGLVDPRMQLTLLLSFLAVFLLAGWLLWLRVESGRLHDEVEALRLELAEA
jgi:heme exporter protein C